MGSHEVQAGWPEHLSALVGHLPQSLEVIRVMWDVPSYPPEDSISGALEKFQLTLDRAREAAVSCLHTYRAQHGVPLQRWEYAVTPGSCRPPLLYPDRESIETVAGSDRSNNFGILMDYALIQDHIDGETTRPEDNPWDLSRCVISSWL